MSAQKSSSLTNLAEFTTQLVSHESNTKRAVTAAVVLQDGTTRPDPFSASTLETNTYNLGIPRLPSFRKDQQPPSPSIAPLVGHDRPKQATPYTTTIPSLAESGASSATRATSTVFKPSLSPCFESPAPRSAATSPSSGAASDHSSPASSPGLHPMCPPTRSYPCSSRGSIISPSAPCPSRRFSA